MLGFSSCSKRPKIHQSTAPLLLTAVNVSDYTMRAAKHRYGNHHRFRTEYSRDLQRNHVVSCSVYCVPSSSNVVRQPLVIWHSWHARNFNAAAVEFVSMYSQL